jgi:hypothetical protein
MGDDGLNVHGNFFPVTQVIDSNTIIVENAKRGAPLDFGVGTNLEFSGNQQPFTIHAIGTIPSLIFNSDISRKVIFTNPVNVNIGDTPMLTVTNFTVSHNRARGILLETRNIDIRNSVFNRTS